MARKKPPALRAVPREDPFVVEMANQLASASFSVVREPAVSWRQHLRELHANNAHQAASTARALAGERLHAEDDAYVIGVVAKGGELYAQALHLAHEFAHLASILHRPSDERAQGLAAAGAENVVRRVWSVLYPSTAADSHERYTMMRMIDRFATSPKAIAAIEASGNKTLLDIVTRWGHKSAGRTAVSKWKLIAQWYASVGGTSWPPGRWRADWKTPPNQAEHSARGLGWRISTPMRG